MLKSCLHVLSFENEPKKYFYLQGEGSVLFADLPQIFRGLEI